MTKHVLLVDYHNPKQARDLITLLDSYASDPMGGDTPLSEQTKRILVGELASRAYAFSIICYVDEQPAGFANCFDGFSTFSCKPLVNIHDLAVHPDFRGQGISQLLLQAIEDIAIEKGCSKITLEVLEGNHTAKHAYVKFGFEGYELNPELGTALFWHKQL